MKTTNTTKPLVVHIYREMLKEASIFREAAKKDTYKARRLYDTLSSELFHWCTELEKTEEVNPSK